MPQRFVELSFNSFLGLLIWFYVLLSLLGCFLTRGPRRPVTGAALLHPLPSLPPAFSTLGGPRDRPSPPPPHLCGRGANNNAQIVLVMPIAYSASLKAGVGFRPFMYLCMFMASISSFNIPIARSARPQSGEAVVGGGVDRSGSVHPKKDGPPGGRGRGSTPKLESCQQPPGQPTPLLPKQRSLPAGLN